MKTLNIILTLWLGLFMLMVSLESHAKGIDVTLKGLQAKQIYNAMTAVQEEGAAGHMYKEGKSISCRYTNADVPDSQGKTIPSGDPRRYACTFHLNQYGYAVRKTI